MKINFLGGGVPARSLNVSAQLYTNYYLDVRNKSPDKADVVAYPFPGLTYLTNPASTFQKFYWWASQSRIYAEGGGNLYDIQSNGTATSHGQIWSGVTAPGIPYFADNGSQLLLTSLDSGTALQPTLWNGTTFTLVGPTGVTSVSCCFIGGYFIIDSVGANAGTFYYSSLYDGTTWNDLDFATAESSPDRLEAVFTYKGILVLFGASTTEFWSLTGDTDLPFTPISGTTGDFGLAVRHSPVIVSDSLYFIARLPNGWRTPARLNGYSIESIATPDVEYLFNSGGTETVDSCTGFRVAGHDFYCVTFQSGNGSYVYDITSGVWSKLVSPNLTISQMKAVAAFGSGVSNVMVGSRHGFVCKLDPDVFTEPDEDGITAAVTRSIVLPHFWDNEDQNNTICRKLRVDIECAEASTTSTTS